ncbi:MAG: hypothetical protein ACTIKH_12770 [Glutamicibacter ardleyensis]|uniref:hypothetical protein n=1 Tax=Glutamicibacter ardleyensis TaxID=225894 RepID=UPI003F9A32F3
MSSPNHQDNRAVQQDARAWKAFTQSNYTAARRWITSPLSQGILGPKLSARHLVSTLETHPGLASKDGTPCLGNDGYGGSSGWNLNNEEGFARLCLIADFLRLFTPTSGDDNAKISSYELKHTAERFLGQYCTEAAYISNGELIWAAAALGLPVTGQSYGSKNLLIGISEAEHRYMRQLLNDPAPRAHHHRPAGLDFLQEMLPRCVNGEILSEQWDKPSTVIEYSAFHLWLTEQSRRNDRVGDFTSDYIAGVEMNEHKIAQSPSDLLEILAGISHSPDAYDSMVEAISGWYATSPDSEPIRRPMIENESGSHAGYGAGPGSIERLVFRCPCGDGQIIEEHENIPGFREHDHWFDCAKCKGEWRFAENRTVRDWAIIPR